LQDSQKEWHTRNEDVNQLACAKASRSAAMVDCVVVKPDIFDATQITRHQSRGSNSASTRMSARDVPWRKIKIQSDSIMRTALSVPTDWLALSTSSRTPSSAPSAVVRGGTVGFGGASKGEASVARALWFDTAIAERGKCGKLY
jgi:hypothetical protein